MKKSMLSLCLAVLILSGCSKTATPAFKMNVAKPQGVNDLLALGRSGEAARGARERKRLIAAASRKKAESHMAMKLWTRAGKILVNGFGLPILCEACPPCAPEPGADDPTCGVPPTIPSTLYMTVTSGVMGGYTAELTYGVGDVGSAWYGTFAGGCAAGLTVAVRCDVAGWHVRIVGYGGEFTMSGSIDPFYKTGGLSFGGAGGCPFSGDVDTVVVTE